MNAMMPGLPSPDAVPLIPPSAPFSPAQRAWLNGFLAGIYGGQGAPMSSVAAAPVMEDMPWHDPALELPDRLRMAEGRAPARQLMAAMAQLDCGQCGYLCQTYAEALAEGRETSAGLCVPGGKPTMKAVKALLSAGPAVIAAPPPPEPVTTTVTTTVTGTVGAPVRILSADLLSGPGSAKEVRHIRIGLTGSGLSYLPGDSLGVMPQNDPAMADAILAAYGAPGHAMRDGMIAKYDLARPQDRTLALLAGAATDAQEATALRALQDGDDGAEPDAADLLDLIEAFPSARPPIADLVRSLPALKPRLYSIASAPEAAPGEVHLCVSVVRTDRRGRVRPGVASAYLADHATDGRPVLATVITSHFRLPSDPATAVIMIGPGTGIAPFRAFLQARAHEPAPGPAWLFFGDQHADRDYLYRPEIEAWRASGTLSRVSLAFSRDQKQKIYVQDRMREDAADLWHWLQGGAHLYVCGDASRMARDVDHALRDVAQSQGGMDETQARDWIVALARQGRYLRDVY